VCAVCVPWTLRPPAVGERTARVNACWRCSCWAVWGVDSPVSCVCLCANPAIITMPRI